VAEAKHPVRLQEHLRFAMEQWPRPVPSPSKEARHGEIAQSLCMECGLCCDGTLFLRAPVKSDDETDRLLARGIEIVSDRKSTSAIPQPCIAHKNCLCSIYADRPSSRRSFECKLLRRFQKNKISQHQALTIIHEAVGLRDAMKQAMHAVLDTGNCSFDDFTRHLQTRFKEAVTAEAKEVTSELFRRFAALWLCVNKHFRDQWQR
jgi:hypothetical protein